MEAIVYVTYKKIRKGDMKFLRFDPGMWLMGVAPGSDAVGLGWIDIVRKMRKIIPDMRLVLGA